jgi:hypothetical protein
MSVASDIDGQEKEDEQTQEEYIEDWGQQAKDALGELSLQSGKPGALPSLHYPLHRLLPYEPSGDCVPQRSVRLVWNRGKMGEEKWNQ